MKFFSTLFQGERERALLVQGTSTDLHYSPWSAKISSCHLGEKTSFKCSVNAALPKGHHVVMYFG